MRRRAIGLMVMASIAAAFWVSPSGRAAGDELGRLGYKPTKRPGAPGDAVAGLRLFRQHCARCHDAAPLAVQVFGSTARDPTSERLCAFLKSHGITTSAQDCDITAFLQDLAAFVAARK